MTIPTSRRILAIVTVCALLVTTLVALAGCIDPSHQAVATTQENYPIGNANTVTVKNCHGRVTVEVWAGSDVQVTAIKRTWFGDDHLDDVLVEVRSAGSTLEIDAYRLEDNAALVSIDLTVMVPVNTSVSSIETTAGDIWLHGTRGDVELRTSNGAIDVRAVTGFVAATTTNGKITVREVLGIDALSTTNGAIHTDIAAVRGPVEITTRNAPIVAAIEPTQAISLDLETTNGAVDVHELALQTTIDEPERLTGRLNNGGETIRFETTNGRIDLFALQS